MRWPTTQNSEAIPQVGLLQARYLENQRVRQDSVHLSFTSDASFNGFSTTLEAAHGYVHIDTGGEYQGTSYPGHMWDLQYSAFDPIFMLHHA